MPIQATYRFGYSGKRYSFAQALGLQWWERVHPELRRRIQAAMVDCPHDLGVGGGWRSSAIQEQTFRERYLPCNSGSLWWEGQRWCKKDGVASAAPPGRSYHESTDPLGYALAVDMLNYQPAIGWMVANDGRYGVHDFANVNSEPWHYQPIEIPNSRSLYNPNIHTLQYWPLGGGPTVPQLPPKPSTSIGVEHMLVIKQGGTPTAGWVGWYSFDGGLTKRACSSMAHANTIIDLGALDAKTRQRVTDRNWVGVSHVSTVAEADRLLTPYG